MMVFPSEMIEIVGVAGTIIVHFPFSIFNCNAHALPTNNNLPFYRSLGDIRHGGGEGIAGGGTGGAGAAEQCPAEIGFRRGRIEFT